MGSADRRDERLQRARVASQRLRHWLLAGPAQVHSGVEAGGVAGTLDASGQVDYVYGEITGYYLHWLCGAQLAHEPQRARNARAALSWCESRYGHGGALPTRIALVLMEPDWRNHTEFCFDLAMLAGGLSEAAHIGLIEPPRILLGTLLQRLQRFVGNGVLQPVLHRVGDELPDRWSTRSGPFLVKAAARILAVAPWVTLPAELEAACHGHLRRFTADAIVPTAEPVHPTLYYLEGLLALQPGRAAPAAAVLQALLALVDEQGTLPESVTNPQVRRSDIIAQALRVALWLQQAGTPVSAVVRDRLVDALCARIRDDGSLAFQPVDEPAVRPQLNVWCAMFAEQALSWYVHSRNEPDCMFNAADIV